MIKLNRVVAIALLSSVVNLRLGVFLKKEWLALSNRSLSKREQKPRDDPQQTSLLLQSAASSLTCSLHQCMIENACIDSTLKRFEKGPRYNIRLLGHDQEALEEMKQRFLNSLGSRDRNIVYAEPINWSNESTVPDDMPVILHFNTSTAITNRFVAKNCGHELGDGVFPIFRLMHIFHAQDFDLTDLWINSRMSVPCADSLYEALLRLRSKNELHLLSRRPETTQCYGRIYMGVKGISFMAEGGVSVERRPTLQADLEAFRDKMYENLQVSKPSSVNRMLILRKKEGAHMVNLENRDEIVAMIQSNFKSYNAFVVSWSDHGLKEQLEMLRSTKVIISLPGAAVLNAIFMPNQSLLMMFCRQLYDSRKKRIIFDVNNDYSYWFRHFSHIQTIVEDCNSSKVSYNWTAPSTIVDLEYLKDVLSRYAH